MSDIGMPGADGYELLARIRKLPEAEGGLTPAIALTAFVRGDYRNKALLAGFQQHLGKPHGNRQTHRRRPHAAAARSPGQLIATVRFL